MPATPRNRDTSQGSRIGDGPQPPRKPLLPRWVRLLLYPLFFTLLLIPKVRRLRRDATLWNRCRFGLALTASLAAAVGAWQGVWWLFPPAVLILTTALFVRPAVHPDRERELQRRHGADYLVNGGRLVSVAAQQAFPNLPVGPSLYLLLRGREILFVPVGASEQIAATIQTSDLTEILVDGQTYRPIYVSEAKDPPVREREVNQKARAGMTLVTAAGGRLEFEYQGAFAKHLAETAAHAIYSVRKLGTADGVSGESPEIFHIVGR